MGKFLIFTLVVIVAIVGQSNAEEKMIGELMECDHSLKGEVWAVHTQQLMFKKFRFDGGGPGSWVTGLKKPASELKGVYPVGQEAVIFPVYHADQKEPCEIFLWGANHNATDTEVLVNLPDPIASYGVITVFCHAFCNNFGHLEIKPDRIEGIEAAPEGFAANVTACTVDEAKFRNKPEPEVKPCTLENTKKHNKLDGSDCKDFTGTTRKGDDGAQFQPSMVMIIVGVLCFGLFSQYVSK